MFFWKIDEETIRCLIHKQEIHSMGFDLDALTQDHAQMEAFLNAIGEWYTKLHRQVPAGRPIISDDQLHFSGCCHRQGSGAD